MKLIAVVGMAGSGKSELSRFFEKEGFKRIRFGDITDEILEKRGLQINEKNERVLREGLRKEHGMEAYAKLNLPKVKNALEKHNVVVDGLYSWEEYKLLRHEFGKSLVLLAVYSSPNRRYQRLVDRIKRPLTREQAEQRDEMELSHLNKAPPIAMADYTILNNGTLFDLKEEFYEFYEWLREKNKTDN